MLYHDILCFSFAFRFFPEVFFWSFACWFTAPYIEIYIMPEKYDIKELKHEG